VSLLSYDWYISVAHKALDLRMGANLHASLGIVQLILFLDVIKKTFGPSHPCKCKPVGGYPISLRAKPPPARCSSAPTH